MPLRDIVKRIVDYYRDRSINQSGVSAEIRAFPELDNPG